MLSTLVGHPASIACEVRAQPQDYGYADITGSVVHLRPSLCAALNTLAADPAALPDYGLSQRPLAFALFVLAHEARHLRGTRSEAVADWWALRHIKVAARLLGARPVQAEYLSDYAHQEAAELRASTLLGAEPWAREETP